MGVPAYAESTEASTEGAGSGVVEVAKNDLAYKGNLDIMHFSTSEESQANGGSDDSARPWQRGRMPIRISALRRMFWRMQSIRHRLQRLPQPVTFRMSSFSRE